MSAMAKRGLLFLLIGIFIAGCSARTYTVVRDREDQQLAGNLGYISGTPPVEVKDRSDVRTTRTTYVLEFKTPTAQQQDAEAEALIGEAEEIAERARQASIEARRVAPAPKPAPQPQKVTAPKPPVATQPVYTEYTIEKNDTLQKISMKFYNTTRRWMSIYEANKDRIKDPNKIKPGTVIRIPQP